MLLFLFFITEQNLGHSFRLFATDMKQGKRKTQRIMGTTSSMSNETYSVHRITWSDSGLELEEALPSDQVVEMMSRIGMLQDMEQFGTHACRCSNIRMAPPADRGR